MRYGGSLCQRQRRFQRDLIKTLRSSVGMELRSEIRTSRPAGLTVGTERTVHAVTTLFSNAPNRCTNGLSCEKKLYLNPLRSLPAPQGSRINQRAKCRDAVSQCGPCHPKYTLLLESCWSRDVQCCPLYIRRYE